MHIFAFGKCSNIKNMKRFTILAVCMLLATASVFAQNSEKTVIIRENKSGNEKVTIVEKLIHDQLIDPLPDLYYSYLNLRNGVFGPEANVPLRSSSFEWGLYSMDQLFCTKNGHFGMTTGFGIGNSYNYFDHNMVLRVNKDNEAYFQLLHDYSSEEGNGPVNNNAHRSFLRYWSFRLPVMIQGQWEINDKPLVVAAGAEVELRCGMRSFARYGGAKHKVADNLNYEQWGVNALLSIRADNSVVFLRVGLSDMLKVTDTNGKQIDMCQAALGFGFNFD